MKVEKDNLESKRVYSKAYYKRKVRTKAKITYESLTPGITQFLLETSPEWYIQLYGQNISPLYQTEVPEHLKKIIIGVIRHSNHISAIFLTDGSGKYIGNLSEIPMTLGMVQELESYGIDVSHWSGV